MWRVADSSGINPGGFWVLRPPNFGLGVMMSWTRGVGIKMLNAIKPRPMSENKSVSVMSVLVGFYRHSKSRHAL